jgi:hypothetical protein
VLRVPRPPALQSEAKNDCARRTPFATASAASRERSIVINITQAMTRWTGLTLAPRGMMSQFVKVRRH